MPPLRIAIVGCGPAGLAAALLLHRQRHEVVLFDRFAAPRPLGSGLMIQPTGMAVLDRLGLAESVVARGARIRALRGLNERGRVVLDARYGDLSTPGLFGLGIHRASLFDVIFDAVADARISFHGGSEIVGTTASQTGRAVRFADGSASETFDLVVDAAGARSPLGEISPSPLPFGALWTTVAWPERGPFDDGLLEQRYHKADRMVGILPTGRRMAGGKREAAFFWSLRRDALEGWRRRGLESWKAEVRALWPESDVLLDEIADPEQLVFASYSHRTEKQPYARGLFRIGDAWHSASPQLGQGANMALLDAWALAKGIEAGRTLAEGLRMAAARRTGHVRLYQWLTAAFTPLYQSSAAVPPAVRDYLLAPLSRAWPVPKIQSMMVTGLFGAPLGELGLRVPDYEAFGSTASSISASASGLSQSNSPMTRATSSPLDE